MKRSWLDLSCLLLLGIVLHTQALGQQPEADRALQQAHQAWQSHDLPGLVRARQLLQQDPLGDYPFYWLLETQLAQPNLPDESVLQQFFTQYPHSPLAPGLKLDWLKALGRHQNWDAFLRELTPEALQDPEIHCDQLQARWARQDDSALQEALVLWSRPGRPADGCTPLFEVLSQRGELPPALVWPAMRLALAHGSMSQALWVNRFLPPAQALQEKVLTKALAHPRRFLQSLPAGDATALTKAQQELGLWALGLWAQRDPAAAADYWTLHGADWGAGASSWGWQRIVAQAAPRGEAHVLEWFDQITEPLQEDSLTVWWIRAALRQQQWPTVLRAMERLSPAEAQRPEWRYWKARALKAQGQVDAARSLLLPLSQESHYYGLLALEDLGGHCVWPDAPPTVKEDEIHALEPQLSRALRLHQLDLVAESRLEWNAVNHDFNPREKLVAATLAASHEWYDRMIYSIERAGPQQDFSLRFPLPFESRVQALAQQNQLDEAWVYGLMRQESHFYAAARSHSGAMGLMQLMPDTARWLAHKIPITPFRVPQANDVQTNLQLGTFYLGLLQRQLGNPVLATAGYNAGPHRAQDWYAAGPKDPTLFVATIPIHETRGYVENVLFNSTLYAQRLGLPPLSLHERLNTLQSTP